MQIYIASDHAGFELKERIKSRLTQHQWADQGPTDSTRVDYPDYADRVAKLVIAHPQVRGILVCGSGQGMAIRANRYPEIRAGLVWDEDSTRLAREHNDINVLCLGARAMSDDTALRLIDIFLTTPFEGGRHEDRVKKLGSQPKS